MRNALILAAWIAFFSPAAFAAKVGEPAPDFTGQGSDGKTYSLAGMKGKWVVLEWHNQGCPFVKKHYDTGNMQSLQSAWTKKGVLWFSIESSAPGKQGYVEAEAENAYLKEMKAAPTASILDPDGVIGRLYGAKTTPHMFIINPQGKLVYNGAIDDRPSADKADVTGAANYVNAALNEALAGKKISSPSTTPYGCSVKYGK